MTHFRVFWEIDIYTDTSREAAEKALKIQKDPESTAKIFTVCNVSPEATTFPGKVCDTIDLSIGETK